MTEIRAGALRHRLTLQTPIDTPDQAGGVLRTWATTAIVWGAIVAIDMRDDLIAEAPVLIRRHRITIRWRKGIVAGQRLMKGARVFLILVVADPDERRRRLDLTVEERTEP